MKQLLYKGHQFRWETKSETLDLDPFKIKHITEVFQGSPAAKMGIEPGDFLGIVNDQAAVDVDFDAVYGTSQEVYYFVHRPADSLSFHIHTSNLPLGIVAEFTSESILRRSDNYDAEEQELYQLWERGEWTTLLKASAYFCQLDDFFVRLITKILRRKYEGPAILTHGIALYELGKKEKGLKQIQLYFDSYMQGWTTNWHALTYYYLGREELDKGNKVRAEELLYGSSHYCDCHVLEDRLNKLGIDVATKFPWGGKRFPMDFKLQDLEEQGHYQLSNLLAQLNDDALLYLCVMPSYRANGPYNDRVAVYEKIYDKFPESTSPFYVITDVKNLENSNDNWRIENEQRLIKAGKPIVLLFDEESRVAEVLEQTTSPNIYILNKEGVIINVGFDFKLDIIWTLLHREFGDVFEYQELDS